MAPPQAPPRRCVPRGAGVRWPVYSGVSLPGTAGRSTRPPTQKLPAARPLGRAPPAVKIDAPVGKLPRHELCLNAALDRRALEEQQASAAQTTQEGGDLEAVTEWLRLAEAQQEEGICQLSDGSLNSLASSLMAEELSDLLEASRELTGEAPLVASYSSSTDIEDMVDQVEQVLQDGLLVRLVAQLKQLDVELRNRVTNLFCTILRPGLPQVLELEVTEHVRGQKENLFKQLLQGCSDPDISAHCGAVLRSCAKRRELAQDMLQTRRVFDLAQLACHDSFEISSDALHTLRQVLLEHKDASAGWLEENFDEFVATYHGLLQDGDYLVRRQVLRLWSDLLVESEFTPVMQRYVADDSHLRIHMNLMVDQSRSICLEAFNVFKIFVANPQMTPRVQRILFKNKGQLVDFMLQLKEARPNDKQFLTDTEAVVDKLQSLERPRRLCSTVESSSIGDATLEDAVGFTPSPNTAPECSDANTARNH